MGETTAIPALDGDGEITAYVARPQGTPRSAIIVVPEIFGVNAGIRSKCDDWAGLGYLALAPDIFWRFAPGVELDPDVPEQLQEAFGYFGQYDADDGVKDIEAAIRHLRRSEGCANGWFRANTSGEMSIRPGGVPLHALELAAGVADGGRILPFARHLRIDMRLARLLKH